MKEITPKAPSGIERPCFGEMLDYDFFKINVEKLHQTFPSFFIKKKKTLNITVAKN